MFTHPLDYGRQLNSCLSKRLVIFADGESQDFLRQARVLNAVALCGVSIASSTSNPLLRPHPHSRLRAVHEMNVGLLLIPDIHSSYRAVTDDCLDHKCSRSGYIWIAAPVKEHPSSMLPCDAPEGFIIFITIVVSFCSAKLRQIFESHKFILIFQSTSARFPNPAGSP